VRELLAAFGTLKAFNLVTDRDTGASRGFCFCEYMDPSVTDLAISGLSAVAIDGKAFIAKRSPSTAAVAVGVSGPAVAAMPAVTAPTLQEILADRNADPEMRLKFATALASAQGKVHMQDDIYRCFLPAPAVMLISVTCVRLFPLWPPPCEGPGRRHCRCCCGGCLHSTAVKYGVT
jgi:hypothetical protein